MVQIRMEADWSITLSDFGVQTTNVLCWAQLRENLLNQPAAYLSLFLTPYPLPLNEDF